MNIQKQLGKKIIAVLIAATLLLLQTGCEINKAAADVPIKNVILMISDGTSVGVSTLSRWYASYDAQKGTFNTDTRLALDPLVSGLIRTYWKNVDGSLGAITDSAPGGTAFATGYKAPDKFVGVGWDNKPHATLLELAESLNKSTGLVASVRVQDATPAAFTSHVTNREEHDLISSQMLSSGADVVLGGGSRYLQPENRADGRDLVAELKAAGYGYLTTATELKAFQGEKVYGLFAPDFLEYDIDRARLKPEQPSLSEMTDKAISILEKNDNGFFLMVEGSKVDWSAHNNDPAAVVSEFLAFDQAVKIAVDFAAKRKDTMVLIVEDHGTGGISIGNASTNGSYSSFLLKDLIEPLKKAQITGNGALELLAQGKPAEEVLALYGILDPTAEELSYVQTLTPDPGQSTSVSRSTLGKMLSSRCTIGWTTTGHTGEDVLFYSYLPGDKHLTGVFENTDINKIISESWGAQLNDSVCKHYA